MCLNYQVEIAGAVLKPPLAVAQQTASFARAEMPRSSDRTAAGHRSLELKSANNNLLEPVEFLELNYQVIGPDRSNKGLCLFDRTILH